MIFGAAHLPVLWEFLCPMVGVLSLLPAMGVLHICLYGVSVGVRWWVLPVAL